MSYDIRCFALREGETASAVDDGLQAYAEGTAGALTAVDGSRLTPVRSMVDALRRRRPSLEEFVPPHPLPYVNLTDSILPMTIDVWPEWVELSAAYGFEPPERLVEGLLVCVEAVRLEGSYAAFDPQMDRLIKAMDLEDLVRQYCVPSGFVVPKQADGGTRKRAWWKFWH